MEELYNQEEKEEFLNTIELEEVRNIYYYVFLKAKGAELLYGKDLYSFSLNQIGDVMKNINPRTLNSTGNNKSRINNYISWAITNGRRENNINPIQGAGKEWEESFIDKSFKRYFSDVELADIVDNLYNAQDQALIQCIFEGIMGQGLTEILTLNYKNSDWNNNLIKVYNQKTKQFRSVKVSDKCMKLIENAYKQQYYLSEDSDNERELINHEDNIFKNVKWRSTKNTQVSRENLTKRLAVIKDVYELEEFSAINISESGRIKMAADILRDEGKNTLDKEDFAKIGDQYNINKIKVSGYEYYDTSKMRKYINPSNLKELYEVDMVE